MDMNDLLREFNTEEQTTILEIAFQSLNNELRRDYIGETLDLEDHYLIDLRDRLNKIMNP